MNVEVRAKGWRVRMMNNESMINELVKALVTRLVAYQNDLFVFPRFINLSSDFRP